MSQTPKTKKRIKHSDDSAEGKALLHPGLHRIDVQQVLQDEGVRAELARRLPELKASPAFAIIRAKPAPTKPADFADAAGCGAYIESKPSAELAGNLDADEEKIIRVTGRPSLLISHGTFQRPELRTIAALLEPHRQRIETAIRSVGRVEMNLDEIGTAWMVAEGIAITNSHVASVFAGRSGDGFAFRNIGNKPARVAVDFFEEFNNRDTMEFLVQSVLYIADAGEPDIALLKLQKDPSRRFPPPLHLHPMKSALKTRTAIAAIGYPANDPNEDPNLIRSYFGSTFDVKRLSPGEIMTHDKAHGFFTHDCSTLGGNSGSAIIELTTGAVVGLHYAGRSLKANFAVDSATIKKVVTPILSGHRVSLPLQPPPVVRPESAEEERKVSVEDFEGRDGYQEEFLGRQFKLTTPTVSGAAASKVLTFWHFSLQVHKVRKQPWWTAVNINGNELPARNPKRVPTSGWVKDPRLDAKYQIGADFYTKSGFTRGHLVRRLDPVWGEEYEAANIDTFTYANACPQDLDFNGNFWGDLEDEVLTDAHGQKMTVFTGPIFKNTDPTYTNNGVSVVVPYNFFKIPAFVRNGKIVASAYVLSQQSYLEGRDPASWRTYQVPIADVEKQTGINFGKLKQFDTFNVLESANPTGRRLIQSLDDLHPHLFGEASTSDESAVADGDDESVAADADDE